MATRVCLGERVERRPHIEVTIACLAAAEPIFPKTNNTVKESLDRFPNRPLWDGHLIWMQAEARISDRRQPPKKREHLRRPARGNAR